MPEDLANALNWITGILSKLSIPYQVVGGLAARAYGSKRSLVDIDLYVPNDAELAMLASAAEAHLARPPTPHQDEYWELNFLKLFYAGWEIEVAAASTAKVWNRRDSTWGSAAIHFDQSEEILVEGVLLQVMPRQQLIDYKMGLGREVDWMDLRAMGNQDGSDSPTDSV